MLPIPLIYVAAFCGFEIFRKKFKILNLLWRWEGYIVPKRNPPKMNISSKTINYSKAMSKRDISDDICCHYLARPQNKPKNKQNRKKIKKSLKWKGPHYYFAACNKKGVRDTDIYSLRPSCMRLNHHLFSEGHIYYQLTSHKISRNMIFSCPSSSVPNIQVN